MDKNGRKKLSKELRKKKKANKLFWLAIGLGAVGYGVYGFFEEGQLRNQAIETVATIEGTVRNDEPFTYVSFMLNNEQRRMSSFNIRPADE